MCNATLKIIMHCTSFSFLLCISFILTWKRRYQKSYEMTDLFDKREGDTRRSKLVYFLPHLSWKFQTKIGRYIQSWLSNKKPIDLTMTLSLISKLCAPLNYQWVLYIVSNIRWTALHIKIYHECMVKNIWKLKLV